MKTYFNGRFLTQEITGVQRFAYEVIKEIDKILTQNNYKLSIEILMPQQKIKYLLGLKRIKIRKVGKLSGHLWEQVELPYYSRDGLLINLCNAAPIFKKDQIVTIHDAAVFANEGNYSLIFKSWYKFLYRHIVKYSKKVITVSNFSRSEISHFMKTDKDKVVVIYEGKEHILNLESDDEILKRYGLKEKPYLLAVSSLNPNKNFKLIINALKYVDYDLNLAIVGNANSKVFSSSKKSIGNKEKNIRYLGYVNDNELKSLYTNAFVFIYPSFYEGFGLPPIEAMSVGCPVIVSDCASLPEICGDAAIYCNPNDARDLATKLDQLIINKEQYLKFRRRSLIHSKMFSWYKCGTKVLKVILNESKNRKI